MKAARVLVVDDDEALLVLAAGILERGGYEAVTCSAPKRALALAKTVDAVILDVMMPGMSGLEVLHEIRKAPGTRGLPVILLSALGAGRDRVRGLAEGADDYLVKPFEPEELLLRIACLLRPRRRHDLVLSGRLGAISLGNILQEVLESRLTGELRIRGGEGVVSVDGGTIPGARKGALRGVDALLALLRFVTGEFAFIETEPFRDETSRPVSLQGALLEAAWLEDELERRRRYLPAPDAELSLAESPPDAPTGLKGVNTDELATWLKTRGTATMAEAEATELAAPNRIRLAVAWLVEKGILKVSGVGATLEAPRRRSSELEPYLARAAVVAAEAGLSPEVVHVLVVTVADRWPRLAQLVGEHHTAGTTGASADSAPGARRDSEVVRLDYEDGTVLVHLNVLTGISGLRAKAALPLSSVVMVCAGETPDDDDVVSFRQAASVAPENARRLLLLGPSCTQTVEVPGWSVSRNLPGSLSDLLRMAVVRNDTEERADGRAGTRQ